MGIHGLISTFTNARIAGWAKCSAGTGDVTIELRLRGSEALSPQKLEIRPSDGSTYYEFELPSDIQRWPWQDLVDKFDGVLAYKTSDPTDRSTLPINKSALRALDPNNSTAIVAERRRIYSIDPKPHGNLAALTIVFNEHHMLPLWIKYYSGVVGVENLFVLDQGSDKPYTNLPEGVNLVRLPRESFDNWLIMRLVATFQRHLLESYDAVLYADSDEFLCVAPEALEGKSLKSFLLGLPDPVGITRGYNLTHDILNEHAIDHEKPILDQRKYLMRTTTMDKPMISRVPLNWIPGFHKAREGGTVVPGMYMLHLRWYDLDAALAKGNFYRTSKWNPYDVETNTASYQRDSEGDIIASFRGKAEMFKAISKQEFDPDEQITVIPDWMRSEVRI